MSITRKSLADTIDAYDDEIAALQESKRETFASYREQLAETMGKDQVRAEIDAVKAAIRKRQAVAKKGEVAVDEKDVLIDEIFAEITGTVVATHVARGARDDREARRRQRMSESMDDHKALMDEIGAVGLLSPEQVAENKRLADAVARRVGNGPLPNHDPLTGEIIEHRPEPMTAQAGEAEPGATVAETAMVRDGLSATQSTAARKDVRQGRAGREETPAPLTQQGFATPDSLGSEVGRPESATLQSETSGRVDPPSVGTLEPVAGTQAPPVDTLGLAEPACTHDDAAANTKSAPILPVTSGGTPIEHQGLVS